MKISVHETGYTKTIERILSAEGKFKQVKVPANCAIIEHPKGVILYDTGYSKEFLEETSNFPYSMYRAITPVTITNPIVDVLKEKGIDRKDVSHVIISHYHGDHISAVKSFPNAQYISTKEAYDFIRKLTGIKALMKAFVPGLLPEGFRERLSFAEDRKVKLNEKYFPFTEGYDLIDDMSMIGISLPGHTEGQLGLIVGDYAFISDACYMEENYSKNSPPSMITKLIHEDWVSYLNTLEKIKELNRTGNFNIVGSHIKLK